MKCPSDANVKSNESLLCMGTSRAMATTVDAEISKHDISDECHLQNDTV